MSYFKDLLSRRVTQLEKEEAIDACLKANFSRCPQPIFEYVMKTRELSRKYSKDMYTSSIFDYLEKAKINMNLVDTMYSRYSNCEKNMCEQLPTILKELEKL